MRQTIHILNPYDKTSNLTLFSEESEHASILPYVELPWSMAAILD